MSARIISSSFRKMIEASRTDGMELLFATINHPHLHKPYRIVADMCDYVLEDGRYYGCPFEGSWVSDDERPPRAKITVQNVDQEIGLVIRQLESSPQFEMKMMQLSDFGDPIFELDGEPGVEEMRRTRYPLGTPVVEVEAKDLELYNVEGNALSISAEIRGRDISRDFWPFIRVTPDRLPAISRLR